MKWESYKSDGNDHFDWVAAASAVESHFARAIELGRGPFDDEAFRWELRVECKASFKVISSPRLLRANDVSCRVLELRKSVSPQKVKTDVIHGRCDIKTLIFHSNGRTSCNI